MQRDRRDRLLLVRFGVTSAVVVALIGVVLAQAVSHVATARGLDDARRNAEIIARVGVQPNLLPVDLTQGLAPQHRQALDAALASPGIRQTIARVKLWNPHGVVVYSDDHVLIGRRFPIDDNLRRALAGSTVSDMADLAEAENEFDRNLGQLLEVYVPLRFSPDGRPAGVFEVYEFYAPVAAASAREAHMLELTLVIGLLVLWLLLFRLVANASRRLSRYATAMQHHARHDLLTGLPNRTMLLEELEGATVRAAADGESSAVLLLDLDEFKEINDAFGHGAGDRLLQAIAKRLSASLDASATVARLGGDEFVVLLRDVSGREDAVAVAQRITEQLATPLEVSGVTVSVAASIGVVLCPEHSSDAQELLQRADIAMYAAKERREGPHVYQPDLDRNTADRLQLMADLRQAIEGHGLTVHYQPQIALDGGEVVGAEALVRWQHASGRMVPPDEFVPLAEQIGLIDDLTAFVLEHAAATVARWRKEGRDLTVAVNLPMRSLYERSLPEQVAAVLARHGLPGRALELELTEGSVMARPQVARAVLAELALRGVGVAVDDFGTGYSSLGWLSQLPVSRIKIDKSFVTGMLERSSDASIVRSTIELGHSLGVSVVAEGVETTPVLDELARLGCDLAQGYGVMAPATAERVTAWLSTQSVPGVMGSAALS